MDAFRPPRLLSPPHVQTVLGRFLRSTRGVPTFRERWETPDGDFLDVDWLRADSAAPHVLVLHGLEGSSRAGYVVETLRGIARRGWGAVALNFRSCSGELNRTMRAYNSGDFADALLVLERVREKGVTGPLFGMGFSLGGSVLLNLVAQTGAACPVDAAVAVSVPFDLSACERLLDRPMSFNRVYRAMFLRSLKAKTLRKCRAHGGPLDVGRVRRARTIREFDDAVTAPLFGFPDAETYYQRCSAGPQLGLIRRPTLLITAEDDPIAPASALPEDAADNPHVTVLRTERGGHVGFITREGVRVTFWAEARALEFFDRVARGPTKN